MQDYSISDCSVHVCSVQTKTEIYKANKKIPISSFRDAFAYSISLAKAKDKIAVSATTTTTTTTTTKNVFNITMITK